jgi:NAD(P)-dependent dehydrogenase (short-subunit alcohol dehydrogenase family)
MARIAQRTRLGGAILLGMVAAGFVRAVVRRARRLDLDGRVVIVTGGSRGLGLLLAKEFGRRGAKLAIAGRDRAAVEEAERLLQGMGIDVIARPCDLGDRRQAELFIERVADEWGHIDVLVNNAGVMQVGPLESVTWESLDELMRSNFWSAANTTMFALPYLRERAGSARLVNIVSIGGRVALPHMLGYSASKFALMGLSEGLRAELSRAGIKVTSVIPAPMRTGSFYNAQFSGKARREFEWFSLAASLPLLSISAERAARRVVDATVEGRDEIHLGLPSVVLSLLHGVAPRLVGRMMSLVNRALPSAPSVEGDVFEGREIGTPLEHSPLLHLGNEAARKNNEAPPEQAR